MQYDGKIQEARKKNHEMIKKEITEIEDRLKKEVGVSQKRLYKPQTLELDGRYVETVEELMEEVGTDWVLHIVILDYIGDFEGKSDVIRKSYLRGSVYQAWSSSGHYSYQARNAKKNPTWIQLGGDLEMEYQALQDSGVELREPRGKRKVKK